MYQECNAASLVLVVFRKISIHNIKVALFAIRVKMIDGCNLKHNQLIFVQKDQGKIMYILEQVGKRYLLPGKLS